MIDTRNCVAQIHHGPGHQAITRCQVEGAHDIHKCKIDNGSIVGELWWRGDVGFTDSSNQQVYIS